jgi:hypothetical protein
MSPVDDPRYSKARWSKVRQTEQRDAEAIARMEYIKPLVLVAAGVPIGMLLATRGAAGGEAAVGWLVFLGLSIVLSMIALFISSRLFLGGGDPLGLEILRIAGAATIADAVYLLLAGGFVASVASVVGASFVFVGLVVWLFDMELEDAALLAIIIWVLRILLAVAIFAWSLGS